MPYIIIALSAVLIIAFIIDNFFALYITKHKIVFKNLPYSLENTRIAAISDLHKKKYGKNNNILIKKIAKLNPDYIFLCGDMVNRNCTDFNTLRILLKGLTGICSVFYVLGNHELDMSQKYKQALIRTINSSGAVLLDNSTYFISDSFCVAGISLRHENYRVKASGYKNLKEYTVSDINSAIGIRKCFTILLSHNPFFMNAYAGWGTDLVLSGHVHGGIIQLPFIGGLLSPERKFFPKYSSGLYSKNNTVMFVSRGLGKIRLFNPPEIVLIKLNGISKRETQ